MPTAMDFIGAATVRHGPMISLNVNEAPQVLILAHLCSTQGGISHSVLARAKYT
jgi:hypothetical protein